MVQFLRVFFLLVSLPTFGQYKLLTQDTIVNNLWDLGNMVLEIRPGVMIRGTGEIRNGYVSASLFHQIFDTTLSANIRNGITGEASTSWWGTDPSKPNNTRYFQKAFDAAKNKFKLYTPAGWYKDSGTLKVYEIYLGNYVGCTIRWRGEHSYNRAGEGTTIEYLGAGGQALALQQNKGSIIEGIFFRGKFVAPSSVNRLAYSNLSYDQFVDASGYVVMQNHSGIEIDPWPPITGMSGSTGVTIRDCAFNGFATCFATGKSGQTLNGEDLLIERCQFYDTRCAIMSCEAQEKNNVIRNCQFWGSAHTLYRSGKDGAFQAGNYYLYDWNVAGRVIQLFDINQSGWFATKINNIYAEDIVRIGTLNTQGAQSMILSVSNSTFAFAYKNEVGNQYLLNSNSLNVVFYSSEFMYYGRPATEQLSFNGIATYFKCWWSGIMTNTQQGSVIYAGKRFYN